MSHILTLNAGSSSIKFAVFEAAADSVEVVRGQMEGLGTNPHLKAKNSAGENVLDLKWPDGDGPTDHAQSLSALLGWLDRTYPDAKVTAVGHRVVHGGPEFARPIAVDAGKLQTLAGYIPLAPLHQPHNLSGIEAATAAFPGALQVACFDTAFHRAHPFVNDTFALPRRYYEQGVRRYGFHGLSYEYIVSRLQETMPHIGAGRIAVAHLGNGASMCGINDGRSVGSTMGFTALDGLPMGTRCGQIDPGVLLYLMQTEGMDAKQIESLLYKESGLLGMSGISNDMRTLEGSDKPEAREAIDYFVFRIRRELGAMAAIVGGLDALVFTGGIGENSRTIRTLVCSGMEWLGLAIDDAKNEANETDISAAGSTARVLVVKTNEELMIARHTQELMAAARPVRAQPEPSSTS